MAKEVRAKPEDVARLAGDVLDESIDLFDGLKTARGATTLTADLFGNTDSASSVQAAYQLALEAAGTNVERLIAVCEESSESLYQIAFAYQLADQKNADDIDETTPN